LTTPVTSALATREPLTATEYTSASCASIVNVERASAVACRSTDSVSSSG
jgi:hypothetical protein